ncbi:MAG: hypothetical protein P8M78_02050 [Myxococcota bacterium]|nr:hypothetical protein [Myxococcota bacterium]
MRLLRLTLALAVLAIGCTHGKIEPLGEPGPIVGKIRSVSVRIESVSTDRLRVYEELNGNEIIKRDVTAALQKAGRYDPSGQVDLEVVVNNFRLRSEGNAFWAGIYGGVDKLEGSVQFRSPTTAPRSFNFALSGSEHWYSEYDRGDRLDSFGRILGEKIVSVLNP